MFSNIFRKCRMFFRVHQDRDLIFVTRFSWKNIRKRSNLSISLIRRTLGRTPPILKILYPGLVPKPFRTIFGNIRKYSEFFVDRDLFDTLSHAYRLTCFLFTQIRWIVHFTWHIKDNIEDGRWAGVKSHDWWSSSTKVWWICLLPY